MARFLPMDPPGSSSLPNSPVIRDTLGVGAVALIRRREHGHRTPHSRALRRRRGRRAFRGATRYRLDGAVSQHAPPS
ncbi:hypothetical protein EON79_17665 [bacterium]|nr:MAG: hypothetical protein EON79_17665 [bacterium]